MGDLVSHDSDNALPDCQSGGQLWSPRRQNKDRRVTTRVSYPFRSSMRTMPADTRDERSVFETRCHADRDPKVDSGKGLNQVRSNADARFCGHRNQPLQDSVSAGESASTPGRFLATMRVDDRRRNRRKLIDLNRLWPMVAWVILELQIQNYAGRTSD
jgi:hypothetical protein